MTDHIWRLLVAAMQWVDRAIPTSATFPWVHDFLLKLVVVVPVVWVVLCIVDRAATTRSKEVMERWIMRAARRKERTYQVRLGLSVIGLVSLFTVAARFANSAQDGGNLQIAVGAGATAILAVILTMFIRQYPAITVGRRVVSLRHDGHGTWSLHVRRAGAWGFVVRRLPKRANSIRTVSVALQMIEPALWASGIERVRATTPDASNMRTRVRKRVLAERRAKTLAWWGERMPRWDVHIPPPKRWGAWASFWFAVARLECPHRTVERGVVFEVKRHDLPAPAQGAA